MDADLLRKEMDFNKIKNLEKVTRRKGSLWDQIGKEASAEAEAVHIIRAKEKKEKEFAANSQHISDMAHHKLKRMADQ